MDLYCSSCGEPWEMDCLHEEAAARYGIPYYLPEADPWGTPRKEKNPEYVETDYQKVYGKVSQEFRAKGCEALSEAYDGKCSTPSTGVDRTFGLTRQQAAGALYDILGDDMDGAAAMLEDMGY